MEEFNSKSKTLKNSAFKEQQVAQFERVQAAFKEINSKSEALKNSAFKERQVAQLKRVQAALMEAPATRRMLSVSLDIYPGTMCFIIDLLMKSNRCEVLKTDFCQVSNRKAEYLTCDPEQFPTRDQQKLELGE